MPSFPQISLMTQILNLEAVNVLNYSIIENVGIFLFVEEKEKGGVCPKCQSRTQKIHKNIKVTIRDIPMGEQDVFLQVNKPQMRCINCDSKFTKSINFIDKAGKFTKRFRDKIAKEALNSDIKNTAINNRVSEQQVRTILNNLYEELAEEKPKELKRLGIDEIAFVKGQKNYCVVLVNLDTGQIVGMLEKRTEDVICEYLKSWGSDVLEGIEEVSIDLWKPYKNVADKLISQAEIVADRFHVMKQINDELDRERRAIKRKNNKLKNKKSKGIIETLKKSKYALLKNNENLIDEQKTKINEIQKVIPDLYAKYEGKEKFRMIFEKQLNWVDGLLEISDWLCDFGSLFPQSHGTIRRWIGEIIAYFDNRTTQGMVEGINNKLKLIKRRGYGFRNFLNFKVISYLNFQAI